MGLSDNTKSELILEYKSSNPHDASQGVYDQINSHFSEQDQQKRTILETREILGDSASTLTDDQIYDLTNEIQYLVDTWLEEYEQQVFDGKTLKELFQIDV